MLANFEELWNQALACCNLNNRFRASIAGIHCEFRSSCEWTLSLLKQLLNHHAISKHSQDLHEHNIAIVEAKHIEEITPKHKAPLWSGRLTDGTSVLLTKLQKHELHLQVGAEVNIITDGAGGHTVCRITESRVTNTISRRPRPDGYLLPFLQLLLSSYRIYVLHASAAALQGQSILLLGPSGAGKTTMALSLAGAGMGFMGEDLIAVAKQDDEVVAHALLFNSKVEVTPGKGKQIVDSITTDNLKVCRTARINSIISLQRNPKTSHDFIMVSRIQVLKWLLEQGNDLRLMWYPQDWFEVASAIANSVQGLIWNPPPPDDVNLSSIKEMLHWRHSA